LLFKIFAQRSGLAAVLESKFVQPGTAAQNYFDDEVKNKKPNSKCPARAKDDSC
jgi:hypothetical protein